MLGVLMVIMLQHLLFHWEQLPGFGTSTRIAPVVPLTPEFTTSYEGGINLGFFKNRITLDLAIFDQRSTNQIINVAWLLQPVIK